MFGRLTIAKVNAAISRRDALRGCVGKTRVTLDDAPFQVTIGGASWTVARQETRRIIQGLVLDDLQAALAEVETELTELGYADDAPEQEPGLPLGGAQ